MAVNICVDLSLCYVCKYIDQYDLVVNIKVYQWKWQAFNNYGYDFSALLKFVGHKG